MHNPAYIHMQNYAHVRSATKTLAKNTTTLKTEQDFKTINLTT